MSKLGKEGHNGYFRICFNENKAKKGNSAVSLLMTHAKM